MPDVASGRQVVVSAPRAQDGSQVGLADRDAPAGAVKGDRAGKRRAVHKANSPLVSR